MHGVMVYVLVYKYEMGCLGICISSSLHFLIRYLIALLIITCTAQLKNDSQVKLVSTETVSKLGYQFKLGIMSMFMGVWSVWAFEVFTLIASYLSIEEVSAQTVMRSLGLTTFMIPFGCSFASGMLVGRSIGQQS